MQIQVVIPAYFYAERDGAMLTGESQRAPQGMPCEEVERATYGRGKYKTTRVLVRSAAPAGWGRWSGRSWFAWVDADAVKAAV